MKQIRTISRRELLYFDTCHGAVWSERATYTYDHEGD